MKAKAYSVNLSQHRSHCSGHKLHECQYSVYQSTPLQPQTDLIASLSKFQEKQSILLNFSLLPDQEMEPLHGQNHQVARHLQMCGVECTQVSLV